MPPKKGRPMKLTRKAAYEKKKIEARNNPKTELSKVQIERNIRMKKVKPGESLEVWERRVRRKNLMTDAEITKFLGTQKAYIHTVRRERNKIQKPDRVQTDIFEKQYDYLKYSGIIMNYFSIRFGISRIDFEILFMFYNNHIFNKETFDSVCVMTCGHSRHFFTRFVQKGYIRQITENEQHRQEKKVKANPDAFYRVGNSTSRIIGNVYAYLAKLKPMSLVDADKLYSKEQYDILMEMNDDINSYKTGDKRQPSIEDINKNPSLAN